MRLFKVLHTNVTKSEERIKNRGKTERRRRRRRSITSTTHNIPTLTELAPAVFIFERETANKISGSKCYFGKTYFAAAAAADPMYMLLLLPSDSLAFC